MRKEGIDLLRLLRNDTIPPTLARHLNKFRSEVGNLLGVEVPQFNAVAELLEYLRQEGKNNKELQPYIDDFLCTLDADEITILEELLTTSHGRDTKTMISFLRGLRHAGVPLSVMMLLLLGGHEMMSYLTDSGASHPFEAKLWQNLLGPLMGTTITGMQVAIAVQVTRYASLMQRVTDVTKLTDVTQDEWVGESSRSSATAPATVAAT